MEEVKLLYMCGECSNCFPSIEDCKEHMINVIMKILILLEGLNSI